MAGLFKVPPIIGLKFKIKNYIFLNKVILYYIFIYHNPPKILNKELLPQPLGPEITTFIPLLITIIISSTNLSPLGVTIGK